MTRTERKKFIAKLQMAKEFAGSTGVAASTIARATGLAGLEWNHNAAFALGDERYEDQSIKWLLDYGATAKNIAAVFDNSIAAQEALL